MLKRKYSGETRRPQYFFIRDGLTIGTFSLMFRSDGMVEVHSFIIAPQFRAAGFGKAMMRDVIKLCRRLKVVKGIWLNCFQHNLPAVKCYRACGFQLESVGFTMMEGTLSL